MEPDSSIVTFFEKTLPKIGAQFAKGFSSKRDILRQFADDEKLGDDSLHPRKRRQAFAEAWKILVGADFSEDVQV